MPKTTRLQQLRSKARSLKPGRGHLVADMVAALTFAVVNEPQAMGQGKLMLVGVDPQLRDQLAKTGVLKRIGDVNVFVATPQISEALNRAVASAHAWLDLPPGDVSPPNVDNAIE